MEKFSLLYLAMFCMPTLALAKPQADAEANATQNEGIEVQ